MQLFFERLYVCGLKCIWKPPDLRALRDPRSIESIDRALRDPRSSRSSPRGSPTEGWGRIVHASTFQDTALFDGVWGVVGSHTPIHWGSRPDGRTADGRTDGGRTDGGRPAGRPASLLLLLLLLLLPTTYYLLLLLLLLLLLHVVWPGTQPL